MFVIKTKLDKSGIHGIGVYSEEFVPKGKVVHVFLEGFDIVYSDDQYSKFPKHIQEYLNHFAYYSKEEGGHVLCGDNARFVNHSTDPNIQMQDPINAAAIRDINIGDEITENYFFFDQKSNLKIM